MRHKVMGTGGLMLAVLIMLAMSAVAFFHYSGDHITGALGICLPSPNQWNLIPLAGWIIDNVLILAIAVALVFLNKHYNLVKGPDYVMPAAFLILTASIPWLTDHLSASVLLASLNIICLAISFSCYKDQNSTQDIFLVATILSVGSMAQYAFIFMIPAYIVMWLMLKCFRFKEFLALLMGLAAPYWVGVGLGLIPLEAFKIPSLSNLFMGFAPSLKLFILLADCGLSALIFLIFSLDNAVKLYAGNTKIRILNNCLNTLTIVCIICMICDFNNLLTYIVSAFIGISAQIGNLFALRQIKRSWVILLILLVIYLSFYGLIEFLPE